MSSCNAYIPPNTTAIAPIPKAAGPIAAIVLTAPLPEEVVAAAADDAPDDDIPDDAPDADVPDDAADDEASVDALAKDADVVIVMSALEDESPEPVAAADSAVIVTPAVKGTPVPVAHVVPCPPMMLPPDSSGQQTASLPVPRTVPLQQALSPTQLMPFPVMGPLVMSCAVAAERRGR